VADLIDTKAEEASEAATKADDQALSELHAKFMRWFDTSATPAQDNRAQALQARRFAFIPGAQWEGDGWEDFSENMIRVQVNKTRKGLKKIINDYKTNRVTVDFRPVGDTDEETAETLDGRFRADAYRSRAGTAFDNAFEEGVSGGLGAFHLCNDYEDEHDPDNDHQVINIEPIVDADQSVYFDPNSKNYDKSDAKWGCLIESFARQAFEDAFGEENDSDWPQGVPRPYLYDWFAPDVVRVCYWYQVEEQKQRRWTLTNGVTGEEMKVWASDVTTEWLNEQLAGGWTQSGRSVTRKRVHKYIMSGSKILKDCGLIAGSEIPLILFYGERRFIDNKERFNGHVQDAMDPQRIYNSQVSRLVETSATSPRETPIVTPEQMFGHDTDWARAGKDRLPFLYLNPIVGEDGQQQPLGPIGKLEPSQVDPVAAALLQITANDIAELTDSDDGADEVVANVSHEAMDLAATRTDEKTSGYMDNFKLTMEWAGRVYLGMFREIYVEEGRTIATRTDENDDAEATLMQPKVDDQGRYKVINDFTQGRFNVIADVTESSATKRDKTVRKALGVAQIAGAETPLGQAALITAVSNMDGEGIDDFKKFTRRLGLQQGVFQPTEQEQQEMAQAAQQQQGQPDPAETVLLAQAAKFSADADLSKAKANTEQSNTILKLADAHLKTTQADAVGGPDAAPDVPTGLDHATGGAEVVAKLATANLNDAKAAHLRHDMHEKTIRRGNDFALESAAHHLAERQQDHAESQPANDKAAA
jgi:hypothetical protein